MKKLISLALILLCSTSLLTGCSYSDLFGKQTSEQGTVENKSNSEESSEETQNIVFWEPGKTFTVPNIAEINITSVVSTDVVNPPVTDGVYTYQKAGDGETFVLAQGTFKNLLSEDFYYLSNFDGTLIYDNDYKYTISIYFATDDDNDFYTDPTPLQSLNVYFMASVPKDLVNTNKNFTMNLQFKDTDRNPSDIYQYNFTFN